MQEKENIIIGMHKTKCFGEVDVFQTFRAEEMLPSKGEIYRNGLVESIRIAFAVPTDDTYDFYYVFVEDSFGTYPYKVCVLKKDSGLS